MEIIYVDIMAGKIWCQIRLQLWSSFCWLYFPPVRGEGMGDIVILASWKDYFTRAGENMAQHPSNNISIFSNYTCVWYISSDQVESWKLCCNHASCYIDNIHRIFFYKSNRMYVCLSVCVY